MIGSLERRGGVLVLGNRLPYPVDDGWKRRVFHVLRALAGRGPVTLLTFHDGDEEPVSALRAALPGIEVETVPDPRWMRRLSIPLGLLTPRPFLAWRMRSAAYGNAIRRLHATRSFHAVVAELTHLHGHFGALPADVVRIVDTHNIDSVVLERYARHSMRGAARRAYARLTARKLRRQEIDAFTAADAVWVCSAQEVEWVRANAPDARVALVPNGVDTEFFERPGGTEVMPERLVFFGRLDYHPNTDAVTWFAEDVLPLLRSRRPATELHVIGPGVPESLRALAARTPGVTLVGPVQDLREAVASAAAVVVPLRSGGGTRLKILEALSLECAVVSTTVGMEGLSLDRDRDILVADTPGAFAGAVERVLDDATLRASLGRRGRDVVTRRYDWRAIEASIVRSVNDLVHEPVRTAAARSSTSS